MVHAVSISLKIMVDNKKGIKLLPIFRDHYFTIVCVSVPYSNVSVGIYFSSYLEGSFSICKMIRFLS